MVTITNKALEAFKGNNKLIARLMIAFDRGQNTIENWMASKDVRLTTPIAVQIIMEETELTNAEILEESKELEREDNVPANGQQ